MNVLFIMADQLRWDHLSCAGHPYLRTAHLDALARRGVLMRRLDALEILAGVQQLFVDKTGTLTEGQLRCSAVHWLPAEHLVRAVMVLLHWVKVLLQIQQLVFQLVRMREWVHHKA